MKWEHTLAVAQALGEKQVCRAKELYRPAGLRASAYRIIHKLEELGLVAETEQRGFFTNPSGYVRANYGVNDSANNIVATIATFLF